MKSIKLISPDRQGLVADITEALAEQHINIETLHGKTVDSQAVIEIIADQPNEAILALRAKGFKVIPDELITIRIPDEPGASAKITRELNNARLSIRGISTMHRQDGYVFVALSTDNNDVARKLLHDVVV